MTTRIVAIDPTERPSPAVMRRAALIVAVAELFRSLAECENLPPRVMDAADEVKRAALEIGPRP